MNIKVIIDNTEYSVVRASVTISQGDIALSIIDISGSISGIQDLFQKGFEAESIDDSPISRLRVIRCK